MRLDSALRFTFQFGDIVDKNVIIFSADLFFNYVDRFRVLATVLLAFEIRKYKNNVPVEL